jgi:hypothetical protein
MKLQMDNKLWIQVMVEVGEFFFSEKGDKVTTIFLSAKVH